MSCIFRHDKIVHFFAECVNLKALIKVIDFWQKRGGRTLRREYGSPDLFLLFPLIESDRESEERRK